MKFSNKTGKINVQVTDKNGNMNAFIYGTQRSGTNRVGCKKIKKRKVR